MTEHFEITLKTRVADILRYYPELEECLIRLSPSFYRLRNPLLRNTVATMTTIQQAAMVAGIPAVYVLQKLRKAAGLSSPLEVNEAISPYLSECPSWMESITTWNDLDIRAFLNEGKVPLTTVLTYSDELKPKQALRLINDFLPVPVLDLLHEKGFLIWAERENDLYYAYICREI